MDKRPHRRTDLGHSGPMDPKIAVVVARMARAQRQVISRKQALRCGMTPKQVFHAVLSGRWRRLHPGVYLTNSGEPDWHARAWAALLRAGTGAVLSHSAAAYLWGLEAKAPSMLHLAIPHERTITRPPGTRIKRRRSVEITMRQGYPVTSVRQTVLDLTAQPGFTVDETAALLGRAAQRRLLEPTNLLEALASYWHHPMTDQLRRACADATAGVESSLESRILRRVIQPHGLSGFALQVPLDATAGDTAATVAEVARGVARAHGADADPSLLRPDPAPDPASGAESQGGAAEEIVRQRRHVERNDLRNRQLGIRVEGDGVEWHRDTFHEDRRRDRKAAAAGDLTVRVTWDAAEKPCEVALDLALAMTHRGWRGVPTACGPACAVPQRWAAETGRVAG